MFVGTIHLPARAVRLSAITLPTSPPVTISDTALALGGAGLGVLVLALLLRRRRRGGGTDERARRARRIGSVARAAALEGAG
jgi:hypothetical protein